MSHRGDRDVSSGEEPKLAPAEKDLEEIVRKIKDGTYLSGAKLGRALERALSEIAAEMEDGGRTGGGP